MLVTFSRTYSDYSNKFYSMFYISQTLFKVNKKALLNFLRTINKRGSLLNKTAK